MKQEGARHILVITYWDRDDPLIVNYTLPYLRIIQRILPAGSQIHLVTLDKAVRQGLRSPEQDGIVHHPFPYVPFGGAGMRMMLSLVWSLRGIVRREHIDTIHAWCTPAGMIGYLLAIFTRKPLIIDSYEPHAEAMVENGTWKRSGLAFRTLFRFERWQTGKAQAVVAASEGMRAYAKEKYGHVPDIFLVKPACVDLKRFSSSNVKRADLLRSLGLEGKVVAVYAGKFGGIYLEQEVFDLLRVAHDHWGGRLHVLLLTSHSREELLPFMEKAGLKPDMFTIRFVPPHDVPDLMGLADWALTPVKPVPTKRYCTPIKDGEYWALGLPVMITKEISDDSALIERYGIGSVISSLDQAGYEHAVKEMDVILESGDRAQLYGRVRAVAERYRNFEIAESVYRTLYGG
ncbi:MAG: glycosyltransferase [Flavobacteriales bacterium]|jgi:glycosyltransferase involved in cell wall biosynthesis|nr:glycosyltransferase [Flavobacteriales bacterium]